MSPQQEAGSSGDDISIRHLHDVKGVSIYKVLAGGESETLASYNEAVTKSAAERDELDGKGSLQHQDWRGMYTQMLPEHVLGTVPYRWEKAGELLHEEAILIEATFEKLEVVILEHPLFIDASVDGKTKAVIAKKALGIDEDALLMEGLGKDGKVRGYLGKSWGTGADHPARTPRGSAEVHGAASDAIQASPGHADDAKVLLVQQQWRQGDHEGRRPRCHELEALHG